MFTHKGGLVAAVIFMIAGLVICGVSFAALGFDFHNMNTVEYETNSYEVTEPFQGISIQGNTENIAFLPSKDGKCSVVCYEDKKEPHHVRVENEVLTIDKTSSRKWYEYIGIWSENQEMTVYLPQDTYEGLFIDADTGDVDVPDSLVFDTVHIKLDTGSVSFYAEAKKAMEIRTDTGAITMSDLNAGEISLSSDTGKVLASGITCEGDFSIKNGTGKMELDHVTCNCFISNGNTGRITLKNVVASDSFTIETDTGDVLFEHCDAESVYVKTDTGDVTGTFLTGKEFLTDTDTGHVRVPQNSAGGRCEITTDTGDIEIGIE